MKELEAKFFKYCCKNLKHSKEESNLVIPTCSFRNNLTFYDIVNNFINDYYFYDENSDGIRNKLWYYINKWDQKGMLEYGVSLGTAWFKLDPNFGVNRDQYINIIPRRIISHNRDLYLFVKRYKEMRKYNLKTIVQ